MASDVPVVVLPETLPNDLEPFTCPWAQDGFRRALEGMKASSSGVLSYRIGTRALTRGKAADMLGTLGWWAKMMDLYCGWSPLPPELLGRDTARRAVLRDV